MSDHVEKIHEITIIAGAKLENNVKNKKIYNIAFNALNITYYDNV
jgi:hypothetical protein